MKFDKSYELYAVKNDHLQGDESVYNQLNTIFRAKCVNVDFSEMYYLKKLIGKGSFGRVIYLQHSIINTMFLLLQVYLAENQQTKQNFAVKAFDKNRVSLQKKGKVNYLNERGYELFLSFRKAFSMKFL